jgi:ATP-dependent RNA helicase RhlB
MSEEHLTDLPFSRLTLPEALLQGVRTAGFEHCTPIQAKALPIALAGQDVAGQAQTGTGKTAAFLLATFNHLLAHPAAPERGPTQPRAIIIAPTRELAVQIHKDAETLGAGTGYRLNLVFGGTGYDTQRRALEEGVDVLIGTPGRIIDYFKQHVFDLKAIQVMVLDEADRMFDLGFIKDIRFLLRRMPEPTQRLNMLFSATLSHRVMELAYEHMNNPQFVRIDPDRRTADNVEQVLYHTANDEKIPTLVSLLRHMDPARSLVFVNTKDMGERLVGWLQANGFRAEILSGDVPQNMRLRLLGDFSEGRLPILVATDVAARGLHIPDVSHVFNFDLPQNAEDYVHRIGRTARAGKSGDAVSFACERYVFTLPEIETYLGHRIATAKVEPSDLPTLEPPAARRHAHAHGERVDGRGRRPRREPSRDRSRDRSPDRSRETRRDAIKPEVTKVEVTRAEEYKAPPPPPIDVVIPDAPLAPSAKSRARRPFSRSGFDKPAVG